MELAIINGTYRDTSKPSTQTTTASATRKSVSVLVSFFALTRPHTNICFWSVELFTLFLFIACLFILFWLKLDGALHGLIVPLFSYGWFSAYLLLI